MSACHTDEAKQFLPPSGEKLSWPSWTVSYELWVKASEEQLRWCCWHSVVGQNSVFTLTQLKETTPQLYTCGQTQPWVSKRERCAPAKVHVVPLYSEGTNVLRAHAYHGPVPSIFSPCLSKQTAPASWCPTHSVMPGCASTTAASEALFVISICHPSPLNQFYSCSVPITVDCDI